MADITPLANYDSRQRIQILWEYIQRDIVELEAESDMPPEQIWIDFVMGDVNTGCQFFKDFLELFYLSRAVVNEKNDEDVSRLIAKIEAWKNAVKTENRECEDRRKVDLGLVSEGINLFRQYEAVMMQNALVQVINRNERGGR